MIRLAHENGKKVQRFYRHWFGEGSLPLWSRDLDRFAPSELVKELAHRTSVPLNLLEEATLQSMVGLVFAELVTGGLTSWLLTLGVFHRQRRHGGLMACTTCLAQDESPYFRKAWRLSWVTCCSKHGVMLIDRCTCGATLQPHRVDMRERRWLAGEVSLATCWSCGADLRRFPSVKADRDVIGFHRLAELARAQGHVEVAGRVGLHSVLFFQGIRVLLLGAIRAARPDTAVGNTRFEELPIESRASRLADVGRFLADWPNAFRDTFSQRKNIFSHFTRHSPSRPFWIEEEVALLNRSWVKLTEAECEAIASLVEAQHGKFTVTLATELFGRDLSRDRARKRPRITQDDVDMMLAGIDVTVSTSTGIEREDLIRDRTMFLTGRLLKLSQEAIRHLRVDEYVSDVEDEPLGDTPGDAAELQVYLRRYVRLDRIKHPRASSSPWLFLCKGPSGQMSKSLVGQRYSDALKLGDMHLRIPSYQDWIATR